MNATVTIFACPTSVLLDKECISMIKMHFGHIGIYVDYANMGSVVGF